MPSQARAVQNMGYTHLRDCQCLLVSTAGIYRDVLFQSRGGTGKSSGLGFVICQFCKSAGVTFIVTPRMNLVSQTVQTFLKLLAHEYVEVLGLSDTAPGIDWSTPNHLIIVGVPAHLSVLTVPSSVVISGVYFDEADELFCESLMDYSIQCLIRLLREPTRTIFLSATFPPYIVSRIEEGLLLADPSRIDAPHHVKLCVSTSTLLGTNPVLLHLKYHAFIVTNPKLALWEILRITANRKCILFGGNKRIAHTLERDGYCVDLITRSNQTVTPSAQVIVDVHSCCSRGLNISNLTVGISMDLPDKETLLHQFGRIAREENAFGDFFVICSDKSQIDFLSFQLGIEFSIHQFKHPFEVNLSTEHRWSAMQQLINS